MRCASLSFSYFSTGPDILSVLFPKPSVCALPITWGDKFHTNAKQQVKLVLCSLVFTFLGTIRRQMKRVMPSVLCNSADLTNRDVRSSPRDPIRSISVAIKRSVDLRKRIRLVRRNYASKCNPLFSLSSPSCLRVLYDRSVFIPYWTLLFGSQFLERCEVRWEASNYGLSISATAPPHAHTYTHASGSGDTFLHRVNSRAGSRIVLQWAA